MHQIAKTIPSHIGDQYVTLQKQHGFYSHFLRIRRGYETLDTIDILRDRFVGRRSVIKAIYKTADA